MRTTVETLPPPRCTFDDLRPVHILQQTPHGTTEHTVTQAFLNEKARQFTRKLVECQRACDGKYPRVCIIGFMDYLWLRSYAADFLRGGIVQMPTPAMPQDFPNHFTFRNILCIEAIEAETGYTFA